MRNNLLRVTQDVLEIGQNHPTWMAEMMAKVADVVGGVSGERITDAIVTRRLYPHYIGEDLQPTMLACRDFGECKSCPFDDLCTKQGGYITAECIMYPGSGNVCTNCMQCVGDCEPDPDTCKTCDRGNRIGCHHFTSSQCWECDGKYHECGECKWNN